MMEIITLLISLILAIIGKGIYKTIANPVTIYTSSWCVGLIANIIFVVRYKGFVTNGRVFLMILCTEIIFSIFFIWSESHTRRNLRIKDISSGRQSFRESNLGLRGNCFNYQVIILLQIASLIFYFPKFMDSLSTFSLWGTDSFSLIRGISEERTTQVLFTEVIRTVFALPVMYAVTQISMDLIFNKDENVKKRTKISLFVFGIIDVVVVSIANVGRFMILTTLLYFIINYFFDNVWNRLDVIRRKKIKRYGLLMIGVLIVGLVIITKYRSFGLGETYFDRVMYTVISYIGGPIKYFDTAIDIIDKDMRLTYGTALFSGLWDYPLIVIQKILGVDFLRPLEIVYLYNAPLRQINGYGLHFTAFPTILLNMYLDGRFLGVVFDSIVLGLIYAAVYKKANHCGTRRWRLIYNYSFIILVYSILHWDGNRITPLITFLYLFLFTTTNKIKIVLRKGI